MVKRGNKVSASESSAFPNLRLDVTPCLPSKKPSPVLVWPRQKSVAFAERKIPSERVKQFRSNRVPVFSSLKTLFSCIALCNHSACLTQDCFSLREYSHARVSIRQMLPKPVVKHRRLQYSNLLP